MDQNFLQPTPQDLCVYYGRVIDLEDLRSEYSDYADLCKILRPIHLQKNGGETLNAFVQSVDNRLVHLRGSKYTRVCLQYAPFVHLGPGNQLTTFSEEIIRSGHFDIEVFGYAFNTRLPRYGCLFPQIEAPVWLPSKYSLEFWMDPSSPLGY